ncbi:MAG: PEPxxWA-CTERM sorting domain-containing protein [Sphingomonadaceae bacterium]|nr:PEPxxWA-CTERM sorting domain-containing protein [Sphingomonadaceae bacterium]
MTYPRNASPGRRQRRLRLHAAVLTLALICGGTATARTVISDNFDADSYTGSFGQNFSGDAVFTSFSPPGNAPNPASVDLVGTGTSFPFAAAGAGHGLFIDLDGSTGNGNLPAAGALISNAALAAGTYRVSFDLAGNQRGSAAETTALHIVDFAVAGPPTITLIGQTYTPDSVEPFTTRSFVFRTAGGHLTIGDEGPSDEQGNLLDNVRVAAVPEPSAWGLMIAGFGLAGGVARLSRRPAVVAS